MRFSVARAVRVSYPVRDRRVIDVTLTRLPDLDADSKARIGALATAHSNIDLTGGAEPLKNRHRTRQPIRLVVAFVC